MARKAKGIKCSFCKRFGHFLFQDNDDGTVTINCPKSTFAGRKFKNSKEFLERLEVQDVCQDLWDLDDRLRPGIDYEVSHLIVTHLDPSVCMNACLYACADIHGVLVICANRWCTVNNNHNNIHICYTPMFNELNK